ncbi:MAG: sensor domain-containing diguanylate cyclase [Paracoccaceae bacterium]
MGDDVKVPEHLLGRVVRQAACMAAIVSLLFGAAIILPKPIVDHMLARDLEVQAAVWRDRIVSQLIHSEETFVRRRITPVDNQFLTGVVLASDIFRLQLLDAEGRTFWASHPEEVGTFHSHDDHATEPTGDRVLVFLNSPRAHEYERKQAAGQGEDAHAHEPGEADHGTEAVLAEIDAPVAIPGGFGSVEMFVDLTHTRDAFVIRVRSVIAGVALVAAVMGAAFLSAVMRANRRRLKDLRRQASDEHSLLAGQLRMAREVRLLGELNEWLQSSRSLDELFDMVGRFLGHILPDCEGSIYVYSNSRDVLDGCASWNGGHHKDHIHPEECWGLRRGRTYAFGESDIDFTCGHAEPHDGRSYLCIPVLAHGETVGLMHLRSRVGKSVEGFKEGRRLAQMCAEQISLAIANVRMRDQLQDQSIRDPLTGLYNRRHLTDSLRRALNARQRAGVPLSLVAIDVDHFKRFNDNHGHDAGDIVLRAVAAALSEECDRDELACRIGGEELMVLLPATDAKAAMIRAEAMRAAVEAVTVRYGEKTLPRVTISLGVAVAPDNGTQPQELMLVADTALYKAKAAGRNQVVLAELRSSEPAVSKALTANPPSAAA